MCKRHLQRRATPLQTSCRRQNAAQAEAVARLRAQHGAMHRPVALRRARLCQFPLPLCVTLGLPFNVNTHSPDLGWELWAQGLKKP